MKLKNVILLLVVLTPTNGVEQRSATAIQGPGMTNTILGAYESNGISGNLGGSIVTPKLLVNFFKPSPEQQVYPFREQTVNNIRSQNLVYYPYLLQDNQQLVGQLQPTAEIPAILYPYKPSVINLIPYSIIDGQRQLPSLPIRPMCGITTPLGGIFFPGRLAQRYSLNYTNIPLPVPMLDFMLSKNVQKKPKHHL